MDMRLRWLAGEVSFADTVLAHLENAIVVYYLAGKLVTSQEVWHIVFFNKTETEQISAEQIELLITNLQNVFSRSYDGAFSVAEDVVAETMYLGSIAPESTAVPVVVALTTNWVLQTDDLNMLVSEAWRNTFIDNTSS